MNVEEIIEGALALPSEVRASLADRLVESLDPANDRDFCDVWVAEARRRLEELRSGKVQSVPGEMAATDLLKKYNG